MADDHSKKVSADAPIDGRGHMGLYMVKVTNPREVVGWLHVKICEE